MARPLAGRRAAAATLPRWIRPQLTQLVDAAPEGDQWLREIKYDGYRMHAGLDRGAVKLLTRTGLDWTEKISSDCRRRWIAPGPPGLSRRRAVRRRPRRITSFSMIQLASDSGNVAALVFVLFDLLYLDGEDLCGERLVYAGRAGTGIKQAELARLWRRLQPLATSETA
jgi:bifunctional non-homologous end joining protein LigD